MVSYAVPVVFGFVPLYQNSVTLPNDMNRLDTHYQVFFLAFLPIFNVFRWLS